MGGCQGRPRQSQNGDIDKDITNNRNEVFTLSDEDRVRVQRLQKEFNESPNMFLLNMMLMCVQFFRNFEVEMERAWQNQVSNMEKTINNPSNLPLYHKNCLMPDILFEIVTKRVLFCKTHGPDKDITEPLVPQRMYVMHDNIEVPDLDTSEYTSVDAPIYKAAMHDEFVHMGYSKLMKVDEFSLNFLKKQKKGSSDSDTSQTSDSSIASPSKIPRLSSNPSSPKSGRKLAQSRDSVMIKRNPNQTQEEAMDTGDDTDSTYDYASIREEATPKEGSSREQIANDILKMTTLPESCLSMRIVKNIDDFEDDDEEEEGDDEENGEDGRRAPKQEQLFQKRTYFNSVAFMKHFLNLFYGGLGEKMGFKRELVKNAKYHGCVIYVKDEFNTTYEIYPSVGNISWPKSAFEWIIRERKAIKCRNLIFRWPTPNMVEKIKMLEIVLLPLGYKPKRGTNESFELEWTISFPKAERYLETRMSHAQARSYLFILALYKTFLEPENEKLGLSISHIRNHMFWLCEHDFLNWPEEQLGQKVCSVLQMLSDCLAKDQLPDYFIRNKNLFKNIPSRYTNSCNEKIHRILENPVFHFLAALRNIRYTSNKFYPLPDFQKLYEIVTSSASIKETNPALHSAIVAAEGQDQDYSDSDTEENSRYNPNDKMLMWSLKFHNKQEEKRERAKKKREEEEKLRKESERRGSVDSINYSYVINLKEYKEDVFKRRNLLLFFIEQFKKIAKHSKSVGATQQALFYLKQSWYLCQLLHELPSSEEDAKKYTDEINRLEQEYKIENAMGKHPVPQTPRRNSTFNYTESLTKIQIASTVLDKSKLEKNFNVNNVTLELQPVPMKKKKKTQSFNVAANTVNVIADVHENSSNNRRAARPARSRPNSVIIADTTTEQSYL